MHTRIKQYEQLKKNLIILCSSRRIDKYLDIYTNSEVYQPCFSSISKEIKTATVTISNEFKEELTEKSFTKINHLFSNLGALATVGIFDYMYSIDNDRLRDNVSSLKKKFYQN